MTFLFQTGGTDETEGQQIQVAERDSSRDQNPEVVRLGAVLRAGAAFTPGEGASQHQARQLHQRIWLPLLASGSVLGERV